MKSKFKQCKNTKTKALAIHYNKTKRGRKQEKQINIGHWNIVYNAGTTYNIKNNQAASKNLSIYNHTIIGKTIRKIFNVYTNMHTRVKNKMEQV